MELEASEVELELQDSVEQRFWDAFRYLPSRHIASVRQRWAPELHAVLRGAIYYAGVWTHGGGYSLLLYNLAYRTRNGRVPGKRRRLFHALLVTAVPWLWQRISLEMTKRGWSEGEPTHARPSPLTQPSSRQNSRPSLWKYGCWKLMRGLELAHCIATLLHFLRILAGDRKYLTLADRVAGIQVQLLEPKWTRVLDLEWSNRQFVWQSLTDLIVSVAPLVHPRLIRAKLRQILSTNIRPSPLGGEDQMGFVSSGHHSNV